MCEALELAAWLLLHCCCLRMQCHERAGKMDCVMFGCPCLWILGTALEDQETASVHNKLPEHCAQASSLPAIARIEVEEQPQAQWEMLPQDMGWVALHCWTLDQLTAVQSLHLSVQRSCGLWTVTCRFPNPPGSNRCWMNATLQTLLGMEPFMEELERSCRRDGRNNQSTLLQSFFEVVKHRRRGRRLSLHSALR
jgi:hypothetical protein